MTVYFAKNVYTKNVITKSVYTENVNIKRGRTRCPAPGVEYVKGRIVLFCNGSFCLGDVCLDFFNAVEEANPVHVVSWGNGSLCS